MKSKEYKKEFNFSLLHEELVVIPGYVTIENVLGLGDVDVAHYTVHITQDGIRITTKENLEFPDDVILAHDKTKKSEYEIEREAKSARKRDVLDKLGITENELRDLLDEV